MRSMKQRRMVSRSLTLSTSWSDARSLKTRAIQNTGARAERLTGADERHQPAAGNRQRPARHLGDNGMENHGKKLSVAVCEKCGGALASRTVAEFEHAAIGLAGVVLRNAVEEIYCTKCDTVDSVHFPNVDGLTAAIAVARVKQNTKLAGADVRFVRKALGRNQQELAALLGVRNETVSRWETGHQPIEPPTEKLLRALVAIELSERAPGINVDFKELLEAPVPAVRRDLRPAPLVLETTRVMRKENHRRWSIAAWAAVPA
jgi:putative zinc finger/helix-turn-helix YgiT family protein